MLRSAAGVKCCLCAVCVLPARPCAPGWLAPKVQQRRTGMGSRGRSSKTTRHSRGNSRNSNRVVTLPPRRARCHFHSCPRPWRHARLLCRQEPQCSPPGSPLRQQGHQSNTSIINRCNGAGCQPHERTTPLGGGAADGGEGLPGAARGWSPAWQASAGCAALGWGWGSTGEQSGGPQLCDPRDVAATPHL